MADASSPFWSRHTLRPSRPRLILDEPRIRRLRGVRENPSPWQARVADHLRKATADWAEQGPVRRVIEGRRLLRQSRRVLSRVLANGVLHHIDGNPVYAARMEADMLAACAFTDWNPAHFLDTAEIAAALGIGLDWLGPDGVEAPVRKRIVAALVEKAFLPSLAEDHFWVRGTSNWNQVCHSGLALAALSVADEEPDLAGRVIERAVECVPCALTGYQPDGAYLEGPMYWEYGTMYHVLLVAALETALGTDAGLGADPAFLRSAEYERRMIAPSGVAYNYADSHEEVLGPVALAWFAERLGRPDLAAGVADLVERRWDELVTSDQMEPLRFLPLLLLWMEREMPPAEVHRGWWVGQGVNPVAVHSDGGNGRPAHFFGIKGGKAGISHGQMDAGSFIFEVEGIRWVEELGAPSYHFVESAGVKLWEGGQDGERWTVFRLTDVAHSTLTLEGKRHRVDGAAALRQAPAAMGGGIEVDLAPVFGGALAAAVRSCRIERGPVAVIRDDVRPAAPGLDLDWRLVTRAEVALDGSTAVLKRDGRQLAVAMESTPPGAWRIEDISQPEGLGNEPNPGAKVLVWRVRLDGPVTLEARLSPQ